VAAGPPNNVQELCTPPHGNPHRRIVAGYKRRMSASNRILEARARAGLPQSQLAERAGVPQPNLSAYQAGRVQPRPETLARILAATIERPSVVLRRDRERVLELAGRRRAGTVRVFGSIARGEDAVGSDIDILVTFAPEASILDAAGLVLDLEHLLGVPVDVMSDRAEGSIRDRAVAEAVPV
jgi:predicted nucleotidyltransferase